MMPSHGFGPFRRFILGSVTAKVLHDAECPVWTGVHMENAPPLEQIDWKNIVCAIDLGPHADRTLSWAAHLVRDSAAKITVVHATPAVESRPAKYLDTEVFAEMQKQAREEIEHLLERTGVHAQICLEGGDPASVVRNAAIGHDADLLVIGRGSAAGGLGRLRTHAYSIIRQSPCPVVSV
jgi:nucleotide-binding universal stress UspA family protein